MSLAGIVRHVTHLGNTANNAYYNAITLEAEGEGETRSKIIEFGPIHAISAPAWEELDFEVPSLEWVDTPSWKDIPNAVKVNSVLVQFPASWIDRSRTAFRESLLWKGLRPIWQKANSQTRRSIRIAAALVLLLAGARLPLFRPQDPSGNATIIYGSNFLFKVRLPRRTKAMMIAFEHGTARWALSASGDLVERFIKRLYRREIRKCDFALVTNIDPESIKAVRNLWGDNWAAVPHPYYPNPHTPYVTDSELRQELLLSTKSDFLIFLGASHNWSALHDKGTYSSLEAFRKLRDQGIRVGLITLDWGLQATESRAYLSEHGLSDYVQWMLPQPRRALQKLASSCDVSWNQFAYYAIGAFDLRMLEQGVPHVSRGLDSLGVELVGSQAPWYPASSADEIVAQTSGVISEIEERGRDTVLSAHAKRYREWMKRYHSPLILAQIEKAVFDFLRVDNPRWDSFDNGYWGTVTRRQAVRQ